MPDIDPWLSSRMGGVDRTEPTTYKVRDTAKLRNDPTSPLYQGKRSRRSTRRARSHAGPSITQDRPQASPMPEGPFATLEPLSARTLRRRHRAERKALAAQRHGSRTARRRTRGRTDLWVTILLTGLLVAFVAQLVVGLVRHH